MGKSLRLNVHPRVIRVGKMIERGNREFRELSDRDKELLLQADVDIGGLVPKDQIVEYRLQKKLEDSDSSVEKAVVKAKFALNNA